MPICARCNGKGAINCPECDGGKVVEEDQLELLQGPARNTRRCVACKGTGTVTCPDCEGSGVVDDEDD